MNVEDFEDTVYKVKAEDQVKFEGVENMKGVVEILD